MTAIVRNNFRIYNARKFISSLDAVNGTYQNTLYLGIGRPQQWATKSSVDDDPDSPANNFASELTDWADMMFMKRIPSLDISHAMPKRIWAPNTYYDIYRSDYNGYSTDPTRNSFYSIKSNTGNPRDIPTDLSKFSYYCISPQNIIYICLVVPKDPMGNDIPSLVNPDSASSSIPGTSYNTEIGTNILCTSDGYVWLKLANSTDLLAKFETIDYVPVQTVADGVTPAGTASQDQLSWQDQGKFFKGGIYSVKITAIGSGYLSGASGSFKVTNAVEDERVRILGDGSGVEYVVQFIGGKLEKIIVTNPGSGYTWARVVIDGTTGATASAIANLTPLYGIAVDPVKTLNAYYLIVQSIIYDDENSHDSSIHHGLDFTIDNDYRKVVLVSNPKDNSGKLADAVKLDMTHGYVDTSSSVKPNISPDAIITSGESTAVVIDVGITKNDGSGHAVIRMLQVAPTQTTISNALAVSKNVKLNSLNTTFSAGSETFTADSGAYLQPTAVVGSGDIIYADYRRPVSRASKQSEEFKIILEY